MKYQIFFLIIMGILLMGCEDQDKIRIGVISIMSGDFAVVGEQVQRSIELTLDEQNIQNCRC